MRRQEISTAAARLLAVTTLSLCAGTPLRGAPPGDLGPAAGKYHVEARAAAPVAVIAAQDGVVVTQLTAEERLWGQFLLASRGAGDGRGGDITRLIVVQDRFLDSACEFPTSCPGPCNVARVIWTETTANPSGVDIFLDGNYLGTGPGIDPGKLPATNGVTVFSLTPGEHTFRADAMDQGSFGEAKINVLDSQPFRDVKNLTCTSGNSSGNGNCDLVTSWENNGPFPESYLLYVDGSFFATVVGTAPGVILLDQTQGSHKVTVAGLTATGMDMNAFYRGCRVEATCEISCEESACKAPVGLRLCQLSYGAGAIDNAIRASWTNSEAPYGVGINVFRDGQPAGTLATSAQNVTTSLAVLGRFAPGDHSVGVQGDCGAPNGVSVTAEASIKLLPASPHSHAVVNNELTCSYDATKSESSATWSNADPSAFIDVYLQVGEDFIRIQAIPGGSTSVTVSPTNPTDVIVLQFYASVEGGCYGSPFFRCGSRPGKRYIPGLCSGNGAALQISSAVFGLNYLFLGGPDPPCAKACDSNGDGSFNLSDMVYVLVYLFLGGPAPPLWDDKDGDGVKDLTCKIAEEGVDDCALEHGACTTP